MTPLAIVVVGYDRPDSLSRLLDSLNQVAFEGHRVPLIISLDRSGNAAVEKVAETFTWKHGDKTVRTFPQRLGLKRHILACGDLTRDHEHLIVLEDDLYVSENLYHYAVQAISAYRDDDRVAGLALYSYLWNEGCHRPFQPLDSPCDAYFVQSACSWGQIWSRGKWDQFMDWYRQHGDDFPPDPAIPRNVTRWSDQSWLKHHIRYCIETGRFFVFPRVALSTNFSDRGQHAHGQENGYQVPLQEPHTRTYRFPAFEESTAVYDAFFESMALGGVLGIAPGELCVDLYGAKRNAAKRRYWLSMEPANHGIVKSFGLAMRPHEANVLRGIPGESIFLYDTSMPADKNPRTPGDFRDAGVKYDVRNLSYKTLLRYSLRYMFRQLMAKLTWNR